MVAEFSGTSNKIGNGFGVFFLYLFVTFFGGSMDASSYVYYAGIFPTSIRAQGVGVSVSGLFIMTSIYTQAAPVAFANVGWKYYLVFIIISWFGVILMEMFCPETAGLSLEEIDELFGDRINTKIVSTKEDPDKGRSLEYEKLRLGISGSFTEHHEQM
ncbi:general substrate transporter [Penicillium freii]|uniref:Major facilitator superfamily (MFS) profile domain-containing protein n=1 Tax=Penicillium freii TaxID=48697 RepID=A0A101M7L5_PENFR|nr:general substrate transporter [Penicillium freii]KUM55498.1 hypothetical protein ACN42_g11769 [Penicillium freii]